jgi:hypothetical protein
MIMSTRSITIFLIICTIIQFADAQKLTGQIEKKEL